MIRRLALSLLVLLSSLGSLVAGPVQLDWDDLSWPVPSNYSETYTVGTGNVTVTTGGSSSFYAPGSPSILTALGQKVLNINVDFPPSSSNQVPITIDFSHAGGVSGVSVTLFDVDRATGGTGSWDEVVVTATNGSSTFNPTLVIPSPANTFVPPNVVTGVSSANSTSPFGNATFQFAQSGITRVTILYRYPGTASNPAGQAISLHDVNFNDSSPNQPPVAQDDTAGTAVAPVSIDVLENDFDPEDEPLTLSLPSATSAEGGSVVVNNNGTPGFPGDDFIVYTPPNGFLGVDTFTYTISDGTSTDTATVTVNVPPIVADLSLNKTINDSSPTVGQNVVFTLTLQNTGPSAATITATDKLSAGYSFVSASGPGSYSAASGVWSVGSVASGASAVLQITAQVNGTGPYENKAEIRSSSATDPDSTPGNSSTTEDDDANVTPTVNGPPVAVDDTAATSIGVAILIDVLENDSDPNGDTILVSLPNSTTAAGGTVALAGDEIQYTPPPGFKGTDTFQYTASDSTGGSSTATVTVSVVSEQDVSLLKRADRRQALIGDFVGYAVELRNTGLLDLTGLTLVDQLPAGFHLVPGSAKLSGGSGTVTVDGAGPVTFSAIDLAMGETASLTYVARVGALTLRGVVTNRVVATLGGDPIGNEATAEVSVTGDPDFEQTTVLGKVFHDRDGDGWQDPGEEGIPGVRLATVEGLLVETDGHGRYHLAGLDGGWPERGRNFVVKLDPSTLPADAEMTTENPKVRRITQGLVHRFDFGVRLADSPGSCCRIVESKLGEIYFTVDSDAVWPDFVPVLHELAARLSAHGGGVLIISGVSGPRMERVVATLRDLLGDERMGRIEIRQGDPTATPPAGAKGECSSAACATERRYDLELARVEQMGESVLGESVPTQIAGERVDVAGRFRVSLPRGGLVWVTEDPTLVEPRLAVGGPDRLPVRDGRLAEPATFHFYTNYVAFLERAEIVVYDPRDIEAIRSIAEIPLSLTSYGAVTWVGPQGLELVPGQELRYRLRVHDAAGHVDETRVHTTALVDAEGFPASSPRLLQGSGGTATVGSSDEAPSTTPLGGNVLVLMPPPPKRTAETLRKTYTIWPELDPDKRTLNPTEMRQLEPIVADWRELADVKVEIVGHSDSGPLTAAEVREFKDFLGVSEARANMVAEALRQAFGEQSVAISVAALGADEPVASNVTTEGRALNRRVELRVAGDRVSYRAEGRPDPRLVDGESGTAVPLRAGLTEAERSLSKMLEAKSGEEAPPGMASTGPVSWAAERDADGLDAVYGRNDLEQRSIPLRGSRVRIHGQDVRGEVGLEVDGEPAPVDARGGFVVERLLPIGDHRIEVRFKGAGGEGLKSEIPLSVTGRHLFFMALGDATVSGQSTSGDVEPLAGDERFEEDVLVEGRVAMYLKGKIRGKYLITAQIDSREEELGDLLSNLDEKDAGSVFRHLDPDRYYPVYGDDSTTWLDTASQGRMYVRVDWDRSQALWGNYETGLTGNEFAQYDRRLYGARVLHDSVGTTSLGQPRTHATAFASEAQTALGHSEFLGTGGSLYYLKHRDILPGSEKAHVEVRDRDSGRVLSNVALVRGADYEIDEIQGRIVLARPLSQFVAPLAPDLIKDEPLDGDRSVLLVDYEYVPSGFDTDQLTAGARAKQWIGDHVAVGGTYVQENRGGEDYSLHGGDLTLQHGPGTYVKLEYASSEASQTSRFLSDNGGLTFQSVNPIDTAAREGEALGVEARANVRELFGGSQDWVAAGWWRTTDAGFSVARLDPGLETTQYGAELIGQPLERLRVAARASVVEREGDSEDQRISLQGDYRVIENGTLSAELRELSEKQSPSAEPVDALLGALRYTHRIGDAFDLYGTGQFTLDDDGGAYAANDLGTVGARLHVGSRTDLSAEVGSGDRGEAANVGIEHRIGPKHQIYGTYTLSTDRTDAPQANRFSVGQRSTLSDQTRIFSESQYLGDRDHSGVAHLFGLDFTPRPGWTVGFTLQSGALEAQTGGIVDRDAGSVTAGHRGRNTEWLSRVEVRTDSGAEERSQTLTSNRLDWKVRDGVRFLFKLNLAETQDDLDELGDARLIEGGIGVAFRPVRHDRLNLLARYTYLYDLPGAEQENAGTDQRSNVLSTEGVYRFSRRWELGGKLAHRVGSLRTDRGDGEWFDSSTNFAAARVNFNVIRAWDLLVEYRWLDLTDAESTRSGFLAGLDRQLGQHFRVGAGYNFTEFSDDLTELEYESQGWFVNFTTMY